MKRIQIFVLFLIGSFTASAQADLFSTPYKWQIKKWSVSLGQDWDMLGSVEHDYLLSTLREETEMDYSNLEFPKEYISQMACDNPHLRVTATLPVPGWRNADLNVSAMLVANKIDMVDYHYDQNGRNQNLSFNAYTNEAGLEVALLKRKSTRNGAFKLYGGLGTQLGASFGGTVSIDGRNIQTSPEKEVLNFSRYDDNDPGSQSLSYDSFSEFHYTKAGFYQRAFGQIGVGAVILKRFELGFEYRHGVGYRAIPQAELKGTQYRSIAINLGWILR